MNGKIGLDTSILIDYFNGNESAIRFIIKNISQVEVSELAIFEFLCGNLNKKEKTEFIEAISKLESKSIDRETAILASEKYREGKRKGKIIGQQDCLIAASHMSKGTNKIATRNTKHFKEIKGIKVIEY